MGKIFYEKDSKKIINYLKELRDISVFDVLEYDGSEEGKFFIGVNYNFLKSFSDCYLVVFNAHPYIDDTDKDSLKKIIDFGFDARKVVFVGLRKISLEDRGFLDINKITYYELSKIEDLEVLCDFVMERVVGKKVFVYFDVDVVDPAFAPGVRNGEVAGFSSREIVYFARRLALLKWIKGVGVGGFDFNKDREDITSKLVAKILSEFL